MLNRAAVLVRLRQPFVDWINAYDPDPSNKVTLAEGNDENTVYLADLEDFPDFEEWLKDNYAMIFEQKLEAWYTDPNMWPKDRSLSQFKKWCSVDLHTVVRDTGGAPLDDDETEA